jgi:hypothetical protein
MAVVWMWMTSVSEGLVSTAFEKEATPRLQL